MNSRLLRFTPLFILALTFFSVFTASSTCAAATPPNIILIFTDDQGYGDVGCFGSKNIKTPALDRMAKEGRKFTDFYVAAPICSASRAALLTGSYPLRVGITGVLFPRHKIGLNPKEQTIAKLLKSKGYATAAIGKWHLGHLPKFLPTNHGFDIYYGVPYSNDMDPVKGKNRSLDRAWIEKDFSPWNVPLMLNEKVIERPADQRTLTKRYTEQALKFITQNKAKPFFLYMPHTMPHIPLFVADENFVKDPKSAYKATIEEIDASVGRILSHLQELNLEKNTLVVFTTDNGPWLSKKHHGGSAGPLRDGKFSTWEGGMRVPCIMRFPGKIKPNTICDKVAATIDLLPTFANLAGAQLRPNHIIDGKDISPLIFSENATSPHEKSGYFFYRGSRLEAVRAGNYKLRLTGPRRRRPKNKNHKPQPKPAPQLYNLKADIGERNNIASQHPDIVARLTKLAKDFDKSLKTNTRPVGSLGKK